MKNKIIIAIDGHSSCGKSTVAKAIAKELGYIYIDSGAMYRAITLFAMRHKLIINNKVETKKLEELIDNIEISFKYNNGLLKYETYLNNENIETEIRKIDVSENVSYISELKFVRELLVKLQQDLGKNKGIVMDGRDIGTVVFPSAELKIFMTADSKIRAQRRYKELIEKGDNVNFEEILNNVEKRDYIDQNRKESPLKKAKDALLLDNSNLNHKEQLDWILKKIDSLV